MKNVNMYIMDGTETPEERQKIFAKLVAEVNKSKTKIVAKKNEQSKKG